MATLLVELFCCRSPLLSSMLSAYLTLAHYARAVLLLRSAVSQPPSEIGQGLLSQKHLHLISSLARESQIPQIITGQTTLR